MKLIIVESPTKTKSLSKYLGGDFEILASMGHIRDLPKSKMGIEIVKKGDGFEFIPTYETMEKKDDQVRKLRVVASKADEVILASDPDREGEAIAWHVKEMLSERTQGVKKSRTQDKEMIFKRIAFHSITKEAILEALENPREIDMNLVNSQQARRFLDRLVGYKLSPILWKKVRRGLSAGRVQSVAVRLIVERDGEIEKHVPEEYWQIRVQIAKHESGSKNHGFWVELAKLKVTDGETAKKILTDLENGKYVVKDVKKSERKASPNAPFKTSTLQQAAANVLGWQAKRTMSVAQKLYEQGDITYHRTDSFNLAPVAIDGVRDYVLKNFGKEYLPDKPRFYKTSGKVVAQEAHEAIRPTNFEMSPESYGSTERTGEEQKLYMLIWRRTLACQMADAKFDDTRVVVLATTPTRSTESGGQARVYELTANGAVEKFAGWKKVMPSKEKDEVQVLPELSIGEVLEKKKVEGLQKFTQPPARFNDASLIKELEKKGIGRPSTYAAIISTILDRRYVEQKERRFYPTSIGKAVVAFLLEHFHKEMEYEFTAKMETELDDIAAGKLSWEKMLSNFWGLFSDQIVKVDKDAARVGVKAEETGESCPECKEGSVVIRDGKFGKFLSCSRYPECKYKAQYKEYIPDVACEKCGKRIVKKKTSKGRDFYGCEDYPNCTWAAWKLPEKVESDKI